VFIKPHCRICPTNILVLHQAVPPHFTTRLRPWCCRCCRAAEYLGQTSITWSTVSGRSHWSQGPSGWRPMRDRWLFNLQWPMHKRKITVGMDMQRRQQQGRKDCFVNVSFCVRLIVKVSRMETVSVQKSYQKSSDGYLHVSREHSSIGWVMVR